MSILESIGKALNAMGRMMGLVRPAPIAAVIEATPAEQPAVFGPAVAGFVKRAHVERFFLAARLASVAKLNTPLGRKPRLEKRRDDAPAVPAARLGAKKTRINGNRGPRVLTAAVKPASNVSNVVAFPTAKRMAAFGATKIDRKAA